MHTYLHPSMIHPSIHLSTPPSIPTSISIPPSLHLWHCSVQSLCAYVDRTQCFRTSDQLFVLVRSWRERLSPNKVLAHFVELEVELDRLQSETPMSPFTDVMSSFPILSLCLLLVLKLCVPLCLYVWYCVCL